MVKEVWVRASRLVYEGCTISQIFAVGHVYLFSIDDRVSVIYCTAKFPRSLFSKFSSSRNTFGKSVYVPWTQFSHHIVTVNCFYCFLNFFKRDRILLFILVSKYYGFGLMNAELMTTFAKSWVSVPEQPSCEIKYTING